MGVTPCVPNSQISQVAMTHLKPQPGTMRTMPGSCYLDVTFMFSACDWVPRKNNCIYIYIRTVLVTHLSSSKNRELQDPIMYYHVPNQQKMGGIPMLRPISGSRCLSSLPSVVTHGKRHRDKQQEAVVWNKVHEVRSCGNIVCNES